MWLSIVAATSFFGLTALGPIGLPLDPRLPTPGACADYFRPGVAETACDSALASESDKKVRSVLLFRRAYLKVATGDFNKFSGAMDDLDLALELFPINWMALHERSFLRIELGDPAGAEADLTLEADIAPPFPETYTERALARFMQANLAGALEDRERAIELGGANADLIMAKARALMWLGRFKEALGELDQADKIAKRDGTDRHAIEHLREEISVWSGGNSSVCALPDEGKQIGLDYIGNCTRAFLKGRDNRSKADALTARSIALSFWKQHPAGGLDDLRVAYALDPAGPGRFFNLGAALVQSGRYGEAMVYLDRAIAAKPSENEYAMRAMARLSMRNCDGAEDDAKRSIAIKSNALALMTLGDVAFLCHDDRRRAKEHWLAAYRVGGGEPLKPRFAQLGIGWPPE